MNVLILGATSALGEALARSFSVGNNLILTGRDQGRLNKVKLKLEDSIGSSGLETVVVDLSKGPDSLIRLTDKLGQVDIMINAACMTSSLKDTELVLEDIKNYTYVDLLSPLALVSHILRNQTAPLYTIFISSLLPQSKTINMQKSSYKDVYAGCKSLHETYLKQFMFRFPHRVKVCIARIGFHLDRNSIGKLHVRVAKVIERDYQQKKVIAFGTTAKIFSFFYWLTPLIGNFLLSFIRAIREK